MLTEGGAPGAAQGGRQRKGHHGRRGAPKAAPDATAAAEAAPADISADILARVPAAQLQLHTDDLSSDDEAPPRNTIGNVPLEWYKDEGHIGYDVHGKKVGKPASGDGIDKFLASQDNPNFRWTVYDDENAEEYTLTRRDLELLHNLRRGTYAHPEFSEQVSLEGIYTSKVEVHPLSSAPEPKRRFLPSKWEMRKVYRIAKAIREGRYQQAPPKKTRKPPVFLMWGEDDHLIDSGAARGRGPVHIPAPKMPLPGHAASYNPPPEYLFTPEEREAWEKLEPSRRRIDFIPQSYGSLRLVPAYPKLLMERFERCLDLYLCPRFMKNKLNIAPESLLPKLPDPSELRPFPTSLALRYKGHTGRVRCMCISPNGQWLATGSDDGRIRVWDAATARCVTNMDVGGIVHGVAWNPNTAVHLLAAAVGDELLIVFPGNAPAATAEATYRALKGALEAPSADAAPEAKAGSGSRRVVDADGNTVMDEDDADDAAAPRASATGELGPRETRWDASAVLDLLASSQLLASASPRRAGVQLRVKHAHNIRKVCWHAKGDYVVTVAPGAASGAVMIHQLSKHASNCPFQKLKGQVQLAQFHPLKPLLYIANQHSVRVFDLLAGTQVQKLDAGVKWISSMDIHPNGDHLLLGSHDARTVWFDTELSSKPYKTLKYHSAGVRRAVFHPRYPLMATAGDDGNVHIFHARVFNDFVTNPVLVPVKILRAHAVSKEGLGALDCIWHPTQPWIFTGGADGAMSLWHDVGV